MRVDPFYVSNMVDALDQAQATEQQLTNELSSGVRVTSLSQEPVASGENVLLLNQMQQDDSFTQSSSLVQGQLQVADSARQRCEPAHAGSLSGNFTERRHA